MTTPTTRAATLCALLATTALAAPAYAQFDQETPIPTAFKSVDQNGVDLTDGSFNYAILAGSIGAGDSALPLILYPRRTLSDNMQVSFVRATSGGAAKITIVFGDRSETFTGAAAATSFTPEQGNGATLTKLPNDTGYRYVDAGGTVTEFVSPFPYKHGQAGFCAEGNEVACHLLAERTRAPSGQAIGYEWNAGEDCEIVRYDEVLGTVQDCGQYYRLTSVTNSGGYKLSFSYASDHVPQNGRPGPDWYVRAGATFANTRVAGSTALTASFANPTATTTEVTDTEGRLWRVTRDLNGRVARVERPGAPDVEVSHGPNGVTQVVRDGVTTDYARTVSGSTATTTVSDAVAGDTVVVSDLARGRPTSLTDPSGRTTSYAYDLNSRLTRVTAPEGNYVQYTLDARGNTTTATLAAKPGSGLASIVTSASYPAGCADLATCNQPVSTTDARGKVTNYAYDPTHGGLVSVASPPPAAGALRPVTRYGYSLVQGVYMPTSVAACKFGGSGCAGNANEVKTSIAYNANLLPASVGSGAGDNSLTATTALGYDPYGNLLTVDGPLAGAADTVRYHYDNARRRVGAVSPDPDGAGPLPHRGTRTRYNARGQVDRVQTGTVAGQSDADWANFSARESLTATFDLNGRKVKDVLTGGGATHAVTETSYDAIGRPLCTAVRMNPAEYDSLPASACLHDVAGAFGRDRIAKTVYDAAGRTTGLTTALGTTEERTEAMSYTANGRLETVTDGEGNRTTYEYDGHDRAVKTRFPSATLDGVSSTTDYEALTYEGGTGRLTSRRTRGGDVIGYGHDDLGRVTAKDLPTGEPDAAYDYDHLNRLTSATQAGASVSFTHDALGRVTRESGSQGDVDSQYDLAGRRTKLTHPDGFFVDTTYLATGDVDEIRENGLASGLHVLARYGYDDLGRRTSVTRGNGTVTSYAYDGASRLASLAQEMGGTAHDLTLGFSYNPAGQIVGNSRSNDAYAWTGHANDADAYTANGRNQYSQIDGVNIVNDARGNLRRGVEPAIFNYSSENLLVSAEQAGTVQATLAYDPLMRLRRVTDAAGEVEAFGYDGLDRIADHDDTGAVVRRYVHGPGVDEPILFYQGSGTTYRRWLHADERGSVVAGSNNAGTALYVNRYDEYGQPDAANFGRFQYTGQTWLPQVGTYYYKARMYDPELGRFKQPDPIGYGSGLNVYGYTRGDPVNFTDPLGLYSSDPFDTIRFVNQDGSSTAVPDATIYGCRTGGVYPNCNPRIIQISFTNTGSAGGRPGTVSEGGGGGTNRAPQPKRDDKGRECSDAQKLAEDVSDFLGESSSLATDISFYSGAAAVAAAAVGAKPIAAGSAAVSLKSGEAAGYLGIGSAIADVLAGASVKAAASEAVGRIVDQVSRKVPSQIIPDFVKDKMTDMIVGNMEFPKCRR